jgi:hypothetical protein
VDCGQWASENEHKPFRKHSQKSGRWQLHTLLSRVNSSGSRCVLRSPLREDLIDYRDVRREEYSRPPASALYCSDFCGLLSLVIGVADQNLNVEEIFRHHRAIDVAALTVSINLFLYSPRCLGAGNGCSQILK